MESNSGKDTECSAEGSINETSICHETSEESVVYLNNKDELNWVANEIVIEESFNDKAIAISVDDNVSSDSITTVTPNCNADESVSTLSVQRNTTSSSDDSETKLWEYFTEHNSSQLKCKLCLGLFLYQRNASHLLRHVEVVHNLSVLSDDKDVKTSTVLKENIDNSADISKKPSNVVEHTSETVEHETNKNVNSLVGQTNISKAMIEQTNKVQKYFTNLERDKIRCNLCCRVMSNKLNRFTMLRHLKFNHSDTYRCALESSNDEDGRFVKPRRSDCLNSENINRKSRSNEKKETQVKYVEENELSRVWKYFTKVGSRDRTRCNICKCHLKFTKGVNTNLVQHLKSKHKNISIKEKRLCKKSSNIKKRLDEDKECTTSFVLEIIQDGDKCLITNARLHTGNNQTALAELTNVAESLNKNHSLEVSAKLGLKSGDVEREKDETSINPEVKNKIWDYFNRLNMNKRVKCKMCSEVLSYKSSILKLYNHIASKHGVNVTRTSESLNSEFASEVQSTDENLFFEYERKNELTVDDISNINLSSIFDSERSNTKQVQRKIKHKKYISGLWKYFTKLYRDKAMCILCDKTFSYKLGQMSSLIKHLQIQHMLKCSKMKSKRKSENQSVNSMEVRKDKIDVWKFFTRLDDSKVECDLCEHSNIFYHSSGSVSNLRKHLCSKHKYFLDLNCYTKRTILYDGNKIVDTVCNNSENSDHLSSRGIDMKALFEYFVSDPNLRDWITFQNDQISCKLCSGMFLFNDLLNFENTIKWHLQTCHADLVPQSVVTICLSQSVDDSLNNEEDLEMFDEVEEASNSSYNELEAISNEINSYKK